MKRWLPIAAFAGVLAAVVVWPAACRKPPPPSANVGFYFVSDTRGRLVPCGCFSGQYGGLTRLKTVLDNVDPSNSIRVDAGDAIRGAEDYNVIEYRYMLQAYAAMRFDALNLGQREAQLSADRLRGLAQQSPVPLISANLLDARTGAPICEPWKIVQRGPFKVALVGVLDPRVPVENLGQGLAVEKIDITLGKILPALRQKADVIVLIAFTDEATLARLAQDFYELDVVLGGKVSQPAQTLEKQNRSLVFYTGNEGRALGILRARINARSKLTPLDHEIRLLEDTIPEDGSVRALADRYRDEVRTTKLAVDDPANLQANMVPGVKMAATYVGTAACISCHPSAARIWQGSAHAQAMETLVTRRADADPNCIACHTVGFGSPSGYRRELAGQKLTEVGCESCHGPGSLHVAQRQGGQPVTFRFRPLGAGDCQTCHFGEFSRPFDWNRFWPHIQHGKEPANATASATLEGLK
jgi:Cytochrome c554 and c-prime